MSPDAAYEAATKSLPANANRFYGPAGNAGLGAGLFLDNVQYPAFSASENRFAVVKGMVLLLTHECDLEQDNVRPMNDTAIVCPVIPLELFVEQVSEIMPEEELKKFLSNITARYVNRLVYVPSMGDRLPRGGYLYLSLLSHTHIMMLTQPDVERVCITSAFGLQEIDHALERHLRRPKADRLPFQPHERAA